MLATLLVVCLAQDPAQRARDLIEQLKDADIVRRSEAARDLRTLDPANADVDRLLDEAMRSADQDVAVPARAARMHRRLVPLVGDPERFIERLNAPRNDVRWRAIERLMQMGNVAAPLLADLFADLDPQLRSRVLDFLAQTRDSRYIETARLMLAAPINNETWVLNRLAMLGDAGVAPRIRELIGAAQPVARPELVQALGMLRLAEDIPLIRSLLYEDMHGTANVAVGVLATWPEARAAAAEDLHRLSVDGVYEAMLVAAEVPQPGLAAVLRGWLMRADPTNMAYPAFALASLGDREAVPYLLHLVRDQRSMAAALCGLGRLRAREAVWLHRQAQRGNDDLEGAIRRVLGEAVFHANQQNMEYRVRFKDERPGPREEGLLAWAIGQAQDPEAETTLLDLLTKGRDSSKYEACLALGARKSRRAVPHLIDALQDATAFKRIAPPDDPKSVHAAFHKLRAAPAWAQVREAALVALASTIGETPPAGSLDEQVKFWTAWWVVNAGKFPK